jgi:hypothetical protein
VRKPEVAKQEGDQKRERTLQGEISETRDEQQLTLDLLLLHLEGAAPSLDRLLKALEGLALLLEGQLLARTRNAEHHQFALELRELHVSALQRFLRRLACDAFLLQR